ncbi:hypothetical protein DPMN_106971 [Dreissena polymorpha]|uniref:Uncharacterized protein n=1 Tax=Dreissena polymorpha TaxID=45954 RepID=A0A9D4K602_DREPO|nr:hypothetical protein DPMN_106971 [Dreissena polymorpha]
MFSRGKGGKGGPPVVIVPDEPKEKLVEGSSCMSAIIQALCVAGACATGTELYEYIAQLRFGQVCSQPCFLCGILYKYQRQFRGVVWAF